jgi:hypothetical protein
MYLPSNVLSILVAPSIYATIIWFTYSVPLDSLARFYFSVLAVLVFDLNWQYALY